MSAQTTLLQAFAALKRAHGSAVVTVKVQVDANTAVTVEGLRGGTTIARGASKAGLSNSVDVGVTVPTADFADVYSLCGKTATITDASGTVTTGRLLPVRLHALGGLMTLSIGEPDRVTG